MFYGLNLRFTSYIMNLNVSFQTFIHLQEKKLKLAGKKTQKEGNQSHLANKGCQLFTSQAFLKC